jgi:hypothetical protein
MAGITENRLAYMQCSNVAGGAGAYNTIQNLNAMGCTISVKEIDTTVFTGSTQTYTTRLASGGIMDCKYTMSGFFDYIGDATGQYIILQNAIAASELWFKYYMDGVGYVKSQAKCDQIDIKTTSDGTVDFTVSAGSTGTITVA